MNGGHDLGDMHGFGPVRPAAEEPVFKRDWERRAFGLTFCGLGLGLFNIDENRYARERMARAGRMSRLLVTKSSGWRRWRRT